MQSSSQRHGKRFPLFDCWSFLCFDGPETNGGHNIVPCDHCDPLFAYLCIRDLRFTTTSTINHIFHTLFHDYLYGRYVCYLLYLNTIYNIILENMECVLVPIFNQFQFICDAQNLVICEFIVKLLSNIHKYIYIHVFTYSL